MAQLQESPSLDVGPNSVAGAGSLSLVGRPDLLAPVAPHEPAVPIIRIRPSRGWVPLRLAELWDYRELLFFLTWRDVKVRYKQTLLGAAWALIQPVCTMLVFSLFFGQLAKVPSDGVPTLFRINPSPSGSLSFASGKTSTFEPCASVAESGEALGASLGAVVTVSL